MNDTLKTQILKGKVPIFLLTFISLALTFLGAITGMFTYEFQFPSFLELIGIWLNMLPQILLIIYLLASKNGTRATILLPLMFGIILFNLFYSNTVLIIQEFEYFMDTIESRYFRHQILVDFMGILPILVSLILAAISAFKGFRSKVFLTMAFMAAFYLRYSALTSFFYNLRYYIEDEEFIYIFNGYINFWAPMLFYIAILWLGAKNTLAPVFGRPSDTPEEFSQYEEPEAPVEYVVAPPQKEEAPVDKLELVKMLKVLDYQLELQLITEEDYRNQRAEIIDKL